MQTNKVSVAVCLCVYNNEQGLPACLENIESIHHIFHRMVINVVYDISEDNSYQILMNFNKKNEDKSMHQRIPMNIVINTAKRNLYTKTKEENPEKLKEYRRTAYLNRKTKLNSENKMIHNNYSYEYFTSSFVKISSLNK